MKSCSTWRKRPRRKLRGISRAERIGELGIFDNQRVELMFGAIVEMAPIGPEHAESVDQAYARLFRALDPRARVRIHGPFAASDDLRSAAVRLSHFPDVEIRVDELFPRP